MSNAVSAKTSKRYAICRFQFPFNDIVGTAIMPFLHIVFKPFKYMKKFCDISYNNSNNTAYTAYSAFNVPSTADIRCLQNDVGLSFIYVHTVHIHVVFDSGLFLPLYMKNITPSTKPEVYDTILKSWRYGQLSLAYSTEAEN